MRIINPVALEIGCVQNFDGAYLQHHSVSGSSVICIYHYCTPLVSILSILYQLAKAICFN